MAQDSPPGNPPNPQDAQEQFAETAKQQLEALAETQKYFWDIAGKISQVWLDQAQSETALISEMFGRLAAAHSAPDAAAVYQEFANRQLQIITDSNRRLLKDSEDLLKTNTRLFSIKSGGFSS
jgi:hypothetical protein